MLTLPSRANPNLANFELSRAPRGARLFLTFAPSCHAGVTPCHASGGGVSSACHAPIRRRPNCHASPGAELTSPLGSGDHVRKFDCSCHAGVTPWSVEWRRVERVVGDRNSRQGRRPPLEPAGYPLGSRSMLSRNGSDPTKRLASAAVAWERDSPPGNHSEATSPGGGHLSG